ncbi:MAG: MOSC domain-containing protein [Betaproteobacteria bacterium]|nr:MOSC domain-containing protein [Betaproteobacteria bacterium]
MPGNGRQTALFKTLAALPVALGPEGFAGDQQADRSVHGGPDKAVHCFPVEHYARLADRFPEAAAQLVPGSIGENLSAIGFREADVCLGDVFALGETRLQISQPRSPCWKIDARYAVEGMAAFIAAEGIAGWYARVLVPGTVRADDGLLLVERDASAPTLAEALASLRLHRPPVESLATLAAAKGIAAGWRRKILDRMVWLQSNGQL